MLNALHKYNWKVIVECGFKMVFAESLVQTKVMVVQTSTRDTIVEVPVVLVRSWSGLGPDETG